MTNNTGKRADIPPSWLAKGYTRCLNMDPTEQRLNLYEKANNFRLVFILTDTTEMNLLAISMAITSAAKNNN